MATFRKETELKISTFQEDLVFQSSDLSLAAISNMVSHEAIDISPAFQRRDRWKPQSQSRLIESFLLNIPVPPIYLSEGDNGIYSAIDGKQRITAINLFMTNNLKLTGLTVLEELNGLSYSDFPSSITNSLHVRPYVRTVTLLRQSDDEIRFEVFLRLNIAGVPLSPMEIRKVAFRGDYCNMIFEVSENEFLKKQLKIRSNESVSYRKMIDAELVLRFLMMCENWENFNSDFRLSMDKHMAKYSKANSETVSQHAEKFNRAIHFCQLLWGDFTFQRPDGDGWRNQLLAGVYDAEMIAVNSLDDTTLKRACKRKNKVIAATRELFEDDQFFEASTIATNTPSRVLLRVQMIQDLIADI